MTAVLLTIMPDLNFSTTQRKRGKIPVRIHADSTLLASLFASYTASSMGLEAWMLRTGPNIFHSQYLRAFPRVLGNGMLGGASLVSNLSATSDQLGTRLFLSGLKIVSITRSDCSLSARSPSVFVGADRS